MRTKYKKFFEKAYKIPPCCYVKELTKDSVKDFYNLPEDIIIVQNENKYGIEVIFPKLGHEHQQMNYGDVLYYAPNNNFEIMNKETFDNNWYFPSDLNEVKEVKIIPVSEEKSSKSEIEKLRKKHSKKDK